MSRIQPRVSLMATLLFTAACSQTPAQIELRGQNVYGRSGESYAALSPGYTTGGASVIASSAPAQPINISELPPPSSQPFAQAQPVVAAQPQAVASTQKINPWTGRPHFSETSPQPAQAYHPVLPNPIPGRTPAPRTVAKLDSALSKNTIAPAKKQIATSTGGFMWPVANHKVISGFGPKGGGKVNDGINIASGDGEPVWAAADGEVVYTGNELAGYGNMVLIKHTGGKTTTYAHLSRYTVDKYDRIKQGDIIGYVGSTGNVKEPQLHFAIRDGKDPIDPAKYLSRNVAGL